MSGRTWVLIDVQQGIDVPPQRWSGQQLGPAAESMWVEKRRWKGGLSEGVDEIRIGHDTFSVSILPTRGMGIWKAWFGTTPIGWKSPVGGPVHPMYVPLAEPSGLGWLDGFDELLVRCGLESNGAPEHDEQGRLRYPLHGRIANRPAHRVLMTVDETTGEIILEGQVDECRFHFLKLRLHTQVRLKPGELGFRIHDTLENLSASPAEAQMLYHVNFGVPLLDAGSQVVAPARSVVPRNARAAAGVAHWNAYQGEQPGFEEQVYFLELFADANHRTQVLLKNAHGTAGASLEFRTDQLPCFTIWKNTTAVADGYVTGLEPGTNYPNPRSFEGQHGRVIRLDGGAKVPLELTLRYHPDAAAVEQVERQVRALQVASPRVFDSPQPDKCKL
jgi:hypothetical protein